VVGVTALLSLTPLLGAVDDGPVPVEEIAGPAGSPSETDPSPPSRTTTEPSLGFRSGW
jgi:hypothetical protein